MRKTEPISYDLNSPEGGSRFQGRADGLIGLVLKNSGKRSFDPIPLEKSHFYVPGDAKSLVNLTLNNEKSIVIASQNNDSLKVYETKRIKLEKILKVRPEEVKVVVKFLNRSQQAYEFYWGNTFQSQSSRTITVNDKASEISFFDDLGRETRKLNY